MDGSLKTQVKYHGENTQTYDVWETQASTMNNKAPTNVVSK